MLQKFCLILLAVGMLFFSLAIVTSEAATPQLLPTKVKEPSRVVKHSDTIGRSTFDDGATAMPRFQDPSTTSRRTCAPLAGYATDHFIVAFRSALLTSLGGSRTGYTSVDHLITQYHITRIEPVFNMTQGNVKLKRELGMARLFVFHVLSCNDIQDAIVALAADPHVEYAFLDPIMHARQVSTPNDECFDSQWNLHNDGQQFPGSVNDADIDAPEAWGITTGDPDVIIAVLDTGVDLDHLDIQDNLWTNTDELNGIPGVDDDGNGFEDDVHGWDFVNDDPDPQDDNDHGTQVAGIAAARHNEMEIAGVCGNCRIMAVKVLDNQFSGYYLKTVKGIEYAVDKGADIINLSLGVRSLLPWQQSEFHSIIQYAYNENTVLVGVSGNDGINSIEYPARFPEVIAIGATGWDDHRWPNSNYGNELDFVAPGENVLGTVRGGGGDPCNNLVHGTSLAAPHISGIVGLMLSVNDDLEPAEVRQILTQTAEDQVGPAEEDTPGWDQYYGFGRVNAYAAVRAANPIPSVRTDADELFIAPGEQRQIHFTVANEGFRTSSGEGYLSLSVSDGLDIVSWTSDDAPTMLYSNKQPGESGWDRWGNPITLVRELLDAYETYDHGETRQIYVTIRADLNSSSSEWIKYRATFGTPSGEAYINDPEESSETDQQYWPVYKIPVWQGDGPHLSVSPSQLNFGTVEQGQSATQPFYISNSGGGVLAWEAVEDPDESWLSLYPASGTSTGESDPVNVTVDTSGLSPGDTKTGRVAITSNDTSGYVDIIVSVGGNQAPQLTWSDIDPPDGNTGDNTLFTYSVRYLDHDNDPPTTKQIVIDGQSFTMSGSGTTYDDGVIFTFQRTAQQLGAGNHTYHFSFSDGQGGSARLPSSGELVGPLVASGDPWMWISEPDGIGDLVITTVDPNYTITWTATDPDSDPLDIALYYSVVKDTGSLNLIDSNLPNTGSYTWDTSAVPEGSYYIYGISDDGHGQSDFDWSAGLLTVSHSDRPPSTVTWFDALQLSPSGQDAAVALGTNQAVHVVWVSGGLYYANSQDGGLTWNTPRQLCSLDSIAEPAIATDASGNAHIVWEAVPSSEPTNREIYYEKLDSEGNTLIDDMRLTNASKWGFTPDIIVDPNGYIHVVWSDTRNTSGDDREEIFYKRSTNGGSTWSGDTNIANNGGSGCVLRVPAVAADASNVYVVYEDDSPGNEWIYFVKSSSSGTSWGSPTRIDQGGTGRGYAYNPRIVSGDAALHVVFGKGSPRNVAYKKSTNSGSTWTDDRLITDGGDRYRPDIASNGATLYVASNSGDFLESLDNGVTWSQPDSVIGGSEPRIEANADGVHVTWWGSGVSYRRSSFSLPPTIDIITPGAGGASASDSYTIEWIGDDLDPTDLLWIDLYYDVDQDPSAKNNIALGLDNSGMYTWDTTMVPAGSYYIYGVIDDGSTTVSDYSDGRVTINHAPTIDVTEPDGVSDTAHAFYTVQWNAWDPDPDDALTATLYYDVDTNPTAKTFLRSDPDNTGSYLWETSYLNEGTYYIYIEISDGVNPTVSDYSDGSVTIDHPNVPPTLVDPPNQVLWEDDELEDALDLKDYASDYETPTDDLSFAVIGNTNPNCGVTIDANDHIDIAPAANWFGSSAVTVRVSDGEDTDMASFTIEVQAVNDSPWISPIVPDQSEAYEQPITIDLTAYENDVENSGTDLDWYVTGEGYCTVSNEYSDDDILTFTPDNGFVGEDYVTLRLRDVEGAEDFQQLRLTWEEQPIAGLVATSDSPTSLGGITILTATVTAGTNVSYTWAFGDGEMSDGAVVTHSYPVVGIYTAIVTASNSINLITATITVNVVDEEGPTISTPIYDSSVPSDQSLNIQASISDVATGNHGVSQATLYYGYISPYNQNNASGTGPGGNGNGTWTFAISAQGDAYEGQTLRFYIEAWDDDASPAFSTQDNGGSFYPVSITDDDTAPPIFVNPSPATATAGETITFIIDTNDPSGIYDTSSDTTSVYLEWDTDGELVVDVAGSIDMDLLTGDTYQADASIGPFATDDIVTWHVYAEDNDNSRAGQWSDLYDVTITGCPAPSAPSLSSPPNGSSTYDTTPTFSWDNVSGATSYRIQVDDDPGFGLPDIDQTVSDTNYTPGTDLVSDIHYWRVRAINACGEGNWTALWSITILCIPDAPDLASPPNGSIVSDTTPTFSWDSVNGAISYHILVDDNASFSSPEISQTTTVTSYTPITVLTTTTYYWKVQASNTHGEGPWSFVWEITIADSDNKGPTIGTPSYSSSVASNQPLIVEVTINDTSTGNDGVSQAILYYGYTSPYNQNNISGTGPGDNGDGTWAFLVPPQSDAHEGQTLRFYIKAWDDNTSPGSSIQDNNGGYYPVSITDDDILPPTFSNPSPVTATVDEMITLTVDISDPSGVYDTSNDTTSVYLEWDTDGELIFDVAGSVDMDLLAENTYQSNVPIGLFTAGETVIWHIYAEDNDNSRTGEWSDLYYVTITDMPISAVTATNDSPTLLGHTTTLSATVTAGSNVSYNWAFGDEKVSSGAVVSHIYPYAGIYTALVTATSSVNVMTATTVVTVVAALPPEGGSIMPTPGVTVTVAGGTFTDTVVIHYAEHPITDTGSLGNVGLFYELSATYLSTGLPADLPPGQRYTITVTYRQDNVPLGVNEADLALYYWNGNVWVKDLTSAVDVNANTITATPGHFSLWAALFEQHTIYLPIVVCNFDSSNNHSSNRFYSPTVLSKRTYHY